MVVTAPSCKSTVASGACTRKAEPPVISYSLTRPCDKTARTIILAKSKSETASTTLSLAREAALRCTSCPAIDGRATGIVVKGQHEDASARIHHSNRHANRRGWRVIETERSEENQWPLPQAEREACFRRMIKRCFNAACAGSCISTHSHHRAKSHNWMASGNGLTGLDNGMPCDCNGTECGIPP
jgi:hypothetical protein